MSAIDLSVRCTACGRPLEWKFMQVPEPLHREDSYTCPHCNIKFKLRTDYEMSYTGGITEVDSQLIRLV